MDEENSNLAEPLLANDEAENVVENGSSCPDEETNAPSNEAPEPFCIKNELVEMANLGIPLAVSFFCRMVRANVMPCEFCVQTLSS